ncbi:hypothetical protein DQ04_17051020 [Trypanosoma grayi]|uniref:hypothetical protein n=1 Tax=Trypanosoma grayi TaxID=71804 RepID=UPI0004F3F0B5|nr:hypothetical protein DQ04_17051020 [Trypanosoma grayi]KEG05953.1 hypothetical protein DQ04_17051020 [Trypanosoma grayi]
MLYATAASICDTETERKCRVFVGWAQLWCGNVQRAVDIFQQQQREARALGDEVQERRCLAALQHAQSNPTVVNCNTGAHIADFWTEIFAIA